MTASAITLGPSFAQGEVVSASKMSALAAVVQQQAMWGAHTIYDSWCATNNAAVTLAAGTATTIPMHVRYAYGASGIISTSSTSATIQTPGPYLIELKMRIPVSATSGGYTLQLVFTGSTTAGQRRQSALITPYTADTIMIPILLAAGDTVQPQITCSTAQSIPATLASGSVFSLGASDYAGNTDGWGVMFSGRLMGLAT